MGWIKGEGIDAEGAKYLCGDQIINSGKVSTFSNFSVVSENRLTKLPESIPLDQGVLFGCALLTGAGMVYNELKPMATDSVAVLGLGGIGLSAIIALKDIGCKNIIAKDNLSSLTSIAIIFLHPISFSSIIALRPIPPRPKTATESVAIGFNSL